MLTSLLLHLPTRAGRGALRDLAAYALPSLVPGSLRVGSIDALGPGEIALSGVAFADDRGVALVRGALDLGAPGVARGARAAARR